MAAKVADRKLKSVTWIKQISFSTAQASRKSSTVTYSVEQEKELEEKQWIKGHKKTWK